MGAGGFVVFIDLVGSLGTTKAKAKLKITQYDTVCKYRCSLRNQIKQEKILFFSLKFYLPNLMILLI